MAASDLKTLTDANQAKASNPVVSAWVSANAGTGKTTVLVRRILRLLLRRDEGGGYTRPETILCLTYTKAAAAEMENRLFERLSGWAVASDAALEEDLAKLCDAAPSKPDMIRARQLFALTLDTKGGLKIHTIHAFCERLLHRFPIEAGVNAGFEVLDDTERAVLRNAAIETVLTGVQADIGAPLGQAVQQVVAATGEDRFRDIVDVVLSKQEEVRAMHRLDSAIGDIGEAERLALCAALGARPERTETEILKEMAAAMPDDVLGRALADIPAEKATEQTLLKALARVRAAAFPELRAQALCDALLTQGMTPRKTLLTKNVREALPELEQALLSVQEKVAALAREQAALNVASSTGALLTLADAIIAEYERAKAQIAGLDYDDLILRTVRLLTVSRAAAWVLYKLDWGIDHILVDEAQDTSPAQWKVIAALAEEFFSGLGARETDRTVFGVGDEKQSIYSFQGADPASFAHHGRLFHGLAQGADKDFERVPLTVSFRSTEPVLDAVDRVFATSEAGRGVIWDGTKVVHQAIRSGQAGLVELWELEEPDEQEPVHAMRPQDERASTIHARDKLVQRIANTIKHWLDTGERLKARDRAISAGDILILVRSRDAFVPRMIRALKARGIPVAGADRMTLTGQLGVMDLMAVGEFVLLPEDDLTLATVLKSPLIGLDDDDLFRLAHDRRGSLWAALRANAGTDERYGEAHARLADWLGRADTRPPYEFFAGLLEENGMHNRLALISRLGADAGDAIDEFLQLALDYERISHPSLQGFLDWVHKAETQVKRDMEQTRDEVRIMTAHGAKGLEANVVILPDTCKGPSSGGGAKARLHDVERRGAPPDAPGHLVWVPAGTMELDAIAEAKELEKQAAQEEHNRLLYVAMTRARDRLYIAGYKGGRDAPKSCWHRLLEAGLEDLLTPATDGLGLPVKRYEEPGDEKAHAREEGREGVIAARELPEWARRNAPEERPAAMPLTPSSIPGEGEEDKSLAEQDPAPPLDRPDPSRFLRGNIIHALLQYLPDVAAEQWQEKARGFVASQGRDLDETRREEIVAETLAVLEREEFSPLFAPGSQAEVPIVARFETQAHGPVELNGIVDRLVVRDDEVLIVDYKTNRPPPQKADEVAPLYIRQLAAYRAALSRVFPGKPVRAALLWTDGPHLMPIDAERLDDAAAILGIG